MTATIPWRPSNGTGGDIFYEGWCARCHREQGARRCNIFTRTLAFNMDDPEYPKEWVSDPDGYNPRCTAFREPKRAVRRSTIKDKRQARFPV